MTLTNRAFRLPVLALSLAALLPALALAETAPAPAPATITVTGEGVSEAAPDMATLTIGVTTTGASAAEALAANSAALGAVLERLAAAGIAARDIQTAGLSVNPNWSSGSSAYSGQEIAGFTAMNGVSVKVRALDTLGAVLDAAVADGANTLNGLAFGLQDPRPAMDAARVAAVQDATAKAQLIAGAAGLSLVAIAQISEGGGYGGPAPMFKASEAAAGAVPVAAGELAMAASVTVVWQVAPIAP